jgi:hypothetical protein
VSRSTARPLLCLAVITALGLAGCGRKAGLDLPPGPPGAPSVDQYTLSAPAAPPPELGPDGRPLMTPPPPPKRWTPIDWLID